MGRRSTGLEMTMGKEGITRRRREIESFHRCFGWYLLAWRCGLCSMRCRGGQRGGPSLADLVLGTDLVGEAVEAVEVDGAEDGVVGTTTIRRHRITRILTQTQTQIRSETTAVPRLGDQVSGLALLVERLQAMLPRTGATGIRTIKLELAGEIAAADGTMAKGAQGRHQGHLGRRAFRPHGTRAPDSARVHVDRLPKFA